MAHTTCNSASALAEEQIVYALGCNLGPFSRSVAKTGVVSIDANRGLSLATALARVGASLAHVPKASFWSIEGGASLGEAPAWMAARTNAATVPLLGKAVRSQYCANAFSIEQGVGKGTLSSSVSRENCFDASSLNASITIETSSLQLRGRILKLSAVSYEESVANSTCTVEPPSLGVLNSLLAVTVNVAFDP